MYKRQVVTFDPDGRVRTAELRTSTGFKNIDGPLLTSLYAWTATGSQLTERDEVQVAITILFREPATPPEAPEARDAEPEPEAEPETESKNETESEPQTR